MAAMIAHPVCLRPLAGSARTSQAAQGRAIHLVVRAGAPKAEGVRAAAKAVRCIFSLRNECTPLLSRRAGQSLSESLLEEKNLQALYSFPQSLLSLLCLMS